LPSWIKNYGIKRNLDFPITQVRCRNYRNPLYSRRVSRARTNAARRFGRADARYKVRKFVVFSGYLSILLFLAILFEDRLGRLSFAFGVAGAGVAVALQDVLASIAGAFSIGFSKLYAMGDRVQIGDTPA
jgi:small-conductance mechanosensitive channel